MKDFITFFVLIWASWLALFPWIGPYLAAWVVSWLDLVDNPDDVCNNNLDAEWIRKNL